MIETNQRTGADGANAGPPPPEGCCERLRAPYRYLAAGVFGGFFLVAGVAGGPFVWPAGFRTSNQGFRVPASDLDVEHDRARLGLSLDYAFSAADGQSPAQLRAAADRGLRTLGEAFARAGEQVASPPGRLRIRRAISQHLDEFGATATFIAELLLEPSGRRGVVRLHLDSVTSLDGEPAALPQATCQSITGQVHTRLAQHLGRHGLLDRP